MWANATTTMNRTQSMFSCFNPTAKRIGETFAYCLLFVVSLIGNTFVGIVVYKTKNLKKSIDFFIANMAMSDLLLPIFLFPRELIRLYTGGAWFIGGPLGQALCKLTAFVIDVSTTVSIQSLVLIAVNRFVAVVFPLRFPLISSKQCRFFIIVTWIIAMAVRLPELIAFKLVEHQGVLRCDGDWNDAFGETLSFENFIVTIAVLTLYLPLVLIALLYLIIAFKIKSQKTPGEKSANTRDQRSKRERNVLKMSVAIVLMFAVSWLPSTTVNILYLSSQDSTWISSCSFHYFMFIAYFLAVSYCAINPCICFIFSGNYRQGLKNLLRYFFC